MPPDDVDRVVEQAVAWRFTPGGRALIDRRRRSRVERNVRLVVQHLEMEGGIPFGEPEGAGWQGRAGVWSGGFRSLFLV